MRLALGVGDGAVLGSPVGALEGVGTGVAAAEGALAGALGEGRGAGVPVATGAGGRGCSIVKFSRPGIDWAAAGAEKNSNAKGAQSERKAGIGRFSGRSGNTRGYASGPPSPGAPLSQ